MTSDEDVINAAIRAMRQKIQQRPIEPPLPETPPIEPPVLVDEPVANQPKPKRKALSKKSDIAKLPKTWRAQIFAATKPKTEKVSNLSSAVAVLWVTGCRPVELQKGVRISLVDGALVVHILGGKHGMITNDKGSFERGLEWRTLKINPKLNLATEYLAQVASDGKEHFVKYNKDSIRTRINELGRTAFAKKKIAISVSPYSFRHAMGSDVKSCDAMTDEQKSQIMGHLSCDSLQVYGCRRHGGGGVSPVQSVEASKTPHGQYVSGDDHDSTHPKP